MTATADQLIPQHFMAQRAGAHITGIRASHAVALTQPVTVAKQLAAAAAARALGGAVM